MSDIVERINAVADQIVVEGMILRAADVRAGAIEIERLRADNEWLRKVMHNAIAAQDFNEARRALEQARKE